MPVSIKCLQSASQSLDECFYFQVGALGSYRKKGDWSKRERESKLLKVHRMRTGMRTEP